MNQLFSILAGAAGFLFAGYRDAVRRHLSFAKLSQNFLQLLDVVTFAGVCDVAIAAIPASISGPSIILTSFAPWVFVSGLLIAIFLWKEGQRQLQYQRPSGIVCGEALALCGIVLLIATFIFQGLEPHAVVLRIGGLSALVAGSLLIGSVVPGFIKRREKNRILDRLESQQEWVQTEYVAPTHECPRPELWKMVDSQTSEIEVLDFLKALVITVKPELILETGTFIGHSSIKMAEGLRENGFGKLITVEYDPDVFAKAKQRIAASDVGDWIECRNGSSLETEIPEKIDLFFSDSHLNIREDEVRRFLPHIDARGLILMHDASSQFHIVRESALRLEREGLISVVLLSTPRGLVIAQKREGRR